ncbi:MAG TPA: hypothetical protein VN364_13200 [Bellilinea sp.]|nr:hypothetical protein [Bellilinea sp.]
MVAIGKQTHRIGNVWVTRAALGALYVLLVIISALAALFTTLYLRLTGWK